MTALQTLLKNLLKCMIHIFSKVGSAGQANLLSCDIPILRNISISHNISVSHDIAWYLLSQSEPSFAGSSSPIGWADIRDYGHIALTHTISRAIQFAWPAGPYSEISIILTIWQGFYKGLQGSQSYIFIYHPDQDVSILALKKCVITVTALLNPFKIILKLAYWVGANIQTLFKQLSLCWKYENTESTSLARSSCSWYLCLLWIVGIRNMYHIAFKSW